jgi:hypothetical protein
MKEFMSEEARRYYEGGKRVMHNGVPCRVAAWVKPTPGLAFIKAAVAGRVAIDDDNRPDECSRFRFVPTGGARVENCKPSARGNVTFPSRFKSVSGWKPASISLAPYGVLTLTDTSEEEAHAKGMWRDNGNPERLREWLANTADQRRAYWAAYDAARATDAAADWRIAA